MCTVFFFLRRSAFILVLIGASSSARAADPVVENRSLKVGASADARLAATPVRERTRSVVQSDRDFLATIEGLGAESPGTSPEPVQTPIRPTAPSPAPRAATERRSPVSNSPPPVPGRQSSLDRGSPSPIAESASPSRESEAPLERFIESYLDAAEQPVPDAELRFYAQEVDYYDQGKVSRRFIEKDQRSYYQRWPAREFTLLGPPTVRKVSEDGATVRYRIRYKLRGAKQSASGQTENVMRVKWTGTGWKIAGVRERKLR